MTRSARGRTGAAVVLLTAALGLAACTSTKNGNGSGGSPLPTTPAITDSVLPTLTDSGLPTDTSSAPATTSAAPTTTTATTSSKPSPSTPHAVACGLSTLKVRVLRGGAIAGKEIALITFTNVSATACVLSGSPGVRLLLKGTLIGTPSQAATTTAKLVTLAPNAQAESQITDTTSCQAPVSDTARITPPGAAGSVDVPLELRACLLVVDPVSHS